MEDPDPPTIRLYEQICIRINRPKCVHEIDSHGLSLNISCIHATIYPPGGSTIGSISAQILDKAAMQARSPGTMWAECQAFDASHASETKLDKVENYLLNECFPADKQALIDAASFILFIQEVYIEPQFRRKGRVLLALDTLIRDLGVGETCVVLLQAAAMEKAVGNGEEAGRSAVDAHEKLARHWRRMGFEEWSSTDDVWLCLSTDCRHRPRIQDVVPELLERMSPSASLGV